MKLTVKSNRFNYDVIIERNLLDQIEKWIDVKKAYVVISDDNIPKEIINKVISKLNNYMFIEFPEGEKSKSIEQYSHIINLLIDNGINKDINIIALGGGVTGDLVGFISSTLYRGVNLIQIPTTLLSQIDSSIGGKVAINMDKVKNCVGNIYTPSLVLIDPETLNSLPDRHFNNGMAEMIKYGMIYSRELFDFIKNKNVKENIDKLIYECLKIKKYYVEIDEFDNDSRYILNFGHTYGHAYDTLRKKVQLAWDAKVGNNWGAVYDLSVKAFKDAIPRDNFIRRCNLLVGEFSIKNVEIVEPGKKALATIKYQTNQMGFVFDMTAKEEWIWEDGKWRLNLSPSMMSLPFMQKN